MNIVRKTLIVLSATFLLLGSATPASALVRVENNRAGNFCFSIDAWGFIDPPLRICIPLI